MHKKELKVFLIVILAIGSFLGVALWHWQEQKGWCEWKRRSLCIDIPTEEKEKELGKKMTDEELYQYVDSVKATYGIVPPKMCPRCYVIYLIREYYGPEK